MATSPLTLTPAGGSAMRLLSAHVFQFYGGAWIVDGELDPVVLASQAMPSGSVTLSIGGVSMSGTIDPTASGTFGPTGHARIVAGGGAWPSMVSAQDFSNDAGVLSTTVYQATASAIGETVNDLAPVQLGVKFERCAGAASRIFRDATWWVDFNGVTNVGAPRPSATADASLVVTDWDPVQQRAEFTCDTLVLPATTLTDARFNGAPPTVYDVEQIFDERGSRGWAWSGASPASQFVENMQSASLELGRAEYRTLYRYRLIQTQGSRMALQAVTPSAGAPDIIPLVPWSGLAGLSTTLAPSQEVLVGFENADPTLPRIVSYSLQGTPLKSVLDASAEVDVGPSAAAVALAGGGHPIAKADILDAFIKVFLVTWTPVPNDGGAALKSALAAWALATGYTTSGSLKASVGG